MSAPRDSGNRQVLTWVRRIDARFSLPGSGLVGGFLAGALYTFQSASHMIVMGRWDKWIVGMLLAALGACLGGLAGLLLRRPLQDADCDGQPIGQCKAELASGARQSST